MQIEKINENQLQVILNLEDLKKNNISIHSFMCKSFESKNLFSSILNFANEEIGFCIKNYKINIEVFLVLTKSFFVLLITRIPKEAKLHICKTKYGSLKASKSFWLNLNCFENFCMLCASLGNSSKFKSSLYLLNHTYFLHIIANNIRDYFRLSTIATEYSNCIYSNKFVPDENAEIIIKDCAVETAKNFFV